MQRKSVLSLFKDSILFVRDYSKNNEIRKCYGKNNPEIVFYVIRNYTREAGLGSIINYVLLNIKYALTNGYVPIVDMMNYHNAYLDKFEYGKVNSWEKFFYQISPYTLEEVYSSKNVILCGNSLAKRGYITQYNSNEWKEYSDIFAQYIKLRPDIESEVRGEISRKVEDGLNVLGVVCRGTDYTFLRPTAHGIPYSAEETIKEIKLNYQKYEKVYLATEDQDILNIFLKTYDNDKLIYTDQFRFCEKEVSGYLSDMTQLKGVDTKQKGIDYLKVIYTLSRCRSIVGSPCAGLYVSALINGGKHETFSVFEKGKYE